MMTDKATVEMESPVAGKVAKLAGEVGDQIAIGSVLVEIETEGDAQLPSEPAVASEDEQPLADGADDADRGAGRSDPGRRRLRREPDAGAAERRTEAGA